LLFKNSCCIFEQIESHVAENFILFREVCLWGLCFHSPYNGRESQECTIEFYLSQLPGCWLSRWFVFGASVLEKTSSDIQTLAMEE
jgi:hypothetical protein